jgi:transposase
MDVPFLLSGAQMRLIEPYFPLPHRIPRGDDRRIASGIIYVIRGGLMWRDAPKGYDPHKTIYNRVIRNFAELSAKTAERDTIAARTP